MAHIRHSGLLSSTLCDLSIFFLLGRGRLQDDLLPPSLFTCHPLSYLIYLISISLIVADDVYVDVGGVGWPMALILMRTALLPDIPSLPEI